MECMKIFGKHILGSKKSKGFQNYILHLVSNINNFKSLPYYLYKRFLIKHVIVEDDTVLAK